MAKKNGFTIYNDDAVLLARLDTDVCSDIVANVVNYAVHGIDIDLDENTSDYNALVALASLCIINKIKRDRAREDD